MGKLKVLASVVSELRVERARLASQLGQLDEALSVLGNLNGGRPSTSSRRTISAAGRKRISLAQKARWAKRAAPKVQASIAKPKRRMSAASRRKIAAAQRARWAKVKAGKKSA